MGDVVLEILCDVVFSSFIDWVCYATRDKKASAELRGTRKGSGVAHG